MSRYDRELVERLLPAVWDESYAYGMEAPLAPPPGMPRAKADPSKGNTLWAHLSDIRTAWRMAPLRLRERQVLFLMYGAGWRQREIAQALAIAQRNVSQHGTDGVGRITAYLNGEECHDNDEEGDEEQ